VTTSKFNHIFWIIGFIGAITKEKPLLSKKKKLYMTQNTLNEFPTITWLHLLPLPRNGETPKTLHYYNLPCCIYHPNIKIQMKNVPSFIVSSFLYGMRIDAKINMMKKPNANAIA
jgi:hypothetical protein